MPVDYLASKNEDVHSLYSVYRFDTLYTSYHGLNATIISSDRNPEFARLDLGDPLPMATPEDMLCSEMLGKIKSEQMLPRYILTQQANPNDELASRSVICLGLLESLERDGH